MNSGGNFNRIEGGFVSFWEEGVINLFLCDNFVILVSLDVIVGRYTPVV